MTLSLTLTLPLPLALPLALPLPLPLPLPYPYPYPYPYPALRHQVSGSRKATELRKVASLGLPQLLRFMELSFGVRMPSLEPEDCAGPNLAPTSPQPCPNHARTMPLTSP